MRITFSTNLTAADAESRIIAGRIVSWNEIGHTSAGPTKFARDSIELSDDVRLLREHDRANPLGRALSVKEHEAGIDARFRIVGTTAGNDALVEAAEQLRDGLSVGVELLASTQDDDGTLVVTAARLDEVSLVAHPAIDSARVSSVAASDATPVAETQGETMNPEDNNSETVETVEIVEASRARVVASARPAVRPLESAAEYVITSIQAQRGDRDALERVTAAVAQQGTADNTGIVPEPIVGDLIQKSYGDRPLVNASRRLPMPAGGKLFQRPFIVQHSTVGIQATEFAELASQKMTINPVTVSKNTIGGAVEISFQDRDWTDPAIMGIVLSDLARQYAEHAEAITAINLETNATGTKVVIGATPNAKTIVESIYAAAAEVNTATGSLPDTIYASPAMWATLGSVVDGQSRPLFPSLGPVNAGGTSSADSFSGNPLGLRLVVSSQLQPSTLIVGASRYLETYENVGGQLSATNVSTLSTTVAYYGYFATLVALGGAFVPLTAS